MHHYPFHPGDYMLDTAHLSLEADCCYRRCLDLYYVSEGPLMLSKQLLSKRLRVAEALLEEILAEFFTESENGFLHARCDAEIARYQAKSTKRKEAGSLGGKARIKNAEAKAKQKQANASNQNQEPEPRTNKEESLSLPFVSPEFLQAWESWTRHRKEIKKPLKPTSSNQQLENLKAMGEKKAIAAIRHSIAGGWQGIFEPNATAETANKPKIRLCT